MKPLKETGHRPAADRLIAEPVQKPSQRPSLLALLASWEPLDEDFPEIDDLPPLDDVDL